MRYAKVVQVQQPGRLANEGRDLEVVRGREAAQSGTPRPGSWFAPWAVLLLVVACGQASRNRNEGPAGGSATSGAGSVSSSGASSEGESTTGNGSGGIPSLTSASASSQSSGSSAGGSGTGGSGTGGSGTGGSGGGELMSDPECRVENLALIDDCPDGTFCFPVAQDDAGTVYQCTPTCESDVDCEDGEQCYASDDAVGSYVCGKARPQCDPLADEDACSCETFSSAVLVSGTGENCEVVSEDASACFWQSGACLDACIPAYYRYDLGDDKALIVRAYQGEMPPGWVADGQGSSPTSCPVVEATQME